MARDALATDLREIPAAYKFAAERRQSGIRFECKLHKLFEYKSSSEREKHAQNSE